MYSEKTQALLKKLNITVGDRVSIERDGSRHEGILMPRIELGDKDVLIVKLDSGYNVGFSPDKSKITKLAGSQKLESFPKLEVTENSSLPKVSLLATGGTIASRIDYVTGGVAMAMTPEEILFSVREIGDIVSFKSVRLLFNLASEDFGPKQWQVMAEETASELNSGAQGVIITHGTDTMHFSSAALAFMLKAPKPVVLTGAQRSSDRGSSDASFNLLCSAIAAKSDIAEVMVCSHATGSDDYCFLNPATKTRKMHTSRRDTFRPINSLPLAKVFPNGKLEKITEHRKKTDGKAEADTRFEEKIALLKAYPGSDPSIIEWYLSRGCRGFVIEATGLGHVPTSTPEKEKSWIPYIKMASDKGVPVVFAAQPLYGSLNMYVYKNQRLALQAGAIDGKDMLPETAYVKLGCVLGREKNYDKVKQLMQTNLAGEFSQKLTGEEYLY